MIAAVETASGVGVFAALAAGVVSFLSPCVLPLVPGYLSAVSGVKPTELDDAPLRRVLLPALLFVASFSAIFIVLGLGATKLGSSLNDHRDTLERVSAIVIILLGLFFLATPFVARLGREWRVDALMARAGRGGPLVAGAAFAIAWTPCVGPTLGAILTAASLSESTARGAYLLAWYSAGLAIPFLLTAIAFNRMTTVFAVVKRHYAAIVADGRSDPRRDGRADLDRRADAAEHRGAEAAQQRRAGLPVRDLVRHVRRAGASGGVRALANGVDEGGSFGPPGVVATSSERAVLRGSCALCAYTSHKTQDPPATTGTDAHVGTPTLLYRCLTRWQHHERRRRDRELS